MVWRRLVTRNFDQITRVLVIWSKVGQAKTHWYLHIKITPLSIMSFYFNQIISSHYSLIHGVLKLSLRGHGAKCKTIKLKISSELFSAWAILGKLSIVFYLLLSARTPGWKQESYIQGVDARLTSSVPGCPDSWFYVIDVGKNIIIFLDTHFQNVSGNLMQISFWEVKVEAVFTNRFYLNMPFTTFHHSKYTLITGCPHARKT